MGPLHRPIPADPPLTMLWAHQMGGAPLAEAQVPTAALNFIAQPGGYPDFLQRLLRRVPPHAPLDPQVNFHRFLVSIMPLSDFLILPGS